MENNSKNIRPYKDLSSRKISASSSISLSSLLVPLILIVVVILSTVFISLNQNKLQKEISDVNLRLSTMEKNQADLGETSQITLESLEQNLKDANFEIRKLWDLSNKRNKVDIQKLTEQTNEIENLLLTIRNDIEINQKNLLSTQDSVSKNIKKIDDLGLSSEDLISLKLSLNNIDTQLILLDDSVQALNNYRNQLNQVILEIQTQISSVQNSLNSDKVVQN